MTIDRAIEILNPEHREHYDGMDEVNKACRIGMEALERTRWIPCSERMPDLKPQKAGIKYMGENRTVGEWAEALGMSRSTISSRYYRGLPIEKVLAKENLRCHA